MRRARVEGQVQGVGFRPYVARLARELGLTGQIRNFGSTVEILVTGEEGALRRFAQRLGEAPPPARVERVIWTTVARAFVTTGAPEGRPVRPTIPRRVSHSTLVSSLRGRKTGVPVVPRRTIPYPGGSGTIPARGLVPRRVVSGVASAPVVSHPVVSHPVFRIVASTLSPAFPLPIPPDLAPCPACLAEIQGTGRRAAYPFCSCAHCGPRYTLCRALPFERERTAMLDFPLCAACQAEYQNPADRRFHAQTTSCPACGPRLWLQEPGGVFLADPLPTAVAALRQGRIVALKAVGGWQLLVDARNDTAVRMLRSRKQRPSKPFAVLLTDLEMAHSLATIRPVEAQTLAGPDAPIVLLDRGDSLAPSVAPRQPRLGLMLPPSPLQALVSRAFAGPLVCTSGNLHGEPICWDDEDALRHLPADLFLGHNRPILHPADDPVVQVVAGVPRVLRLGRGNAPLRLPLPMVEVPTLAVGAQEHVAPAMAMEGKAVLWPQVGSLGSVPARRALEHAIRGMEALFGRKPGRVVVDAHPDYASTRFAESLGIPLLRVYHHVAHVAACLAEFGEPRALGVAWDGVGLGADGTAWGGEFLEVGPTGFRRVARMRSFPLPGGDAAARDGERVWAGLCAEIGLPVGDPRYRRLAASSPRTSSVGRLFDGVAARLGICGRSTFQGEAAMLLEAAASEEEPYPFTFREGVLDWEPMIRALDADPGHRAPGRFHATLIAMIRQVVLRENAPIVALVGGCFQNRRLAEGALRALEGRRVLLPTRVPPGDGGLALGQVGLAGLWNPSERQVEG